MAHLLFALISCPVALGFCGTDSSSLNILFFVLAGCMLSFQVCLIRYFTLLGLLRPNLALVN